MDPAVKEVKHDEAHVSTNNPNTVKAVPTLLLVPRSKKGLDLSKKPFKLRADYLADFVAAGALADLCAPSPLGATGGTLKGVEQRFYVDLAVPDGKGKFFAHRKITAFVPEAAGKKVKIRWEVIEPKDKGIAGFGLKSGFKEKMETETDADGLSEVTLVYALHKYQENNKKSKITVKATIALTSTESSTQQLALQIARNNDIAKLEEIYEPSAAGSLGNHLLVHQPGNEVESDAVKDLNHLLNQVVSRHKNVEYKFIYQDGKYGDRTKNAVEQFTTNFRRVTKAHWPYDLSTVGAYECLKEYIANEYAPFDYAKNIGAVVDRRLLIGKERCSTEKFEPDKIDGLLELKEAVVDRLIAAMRGMAQRYFDCDLPWLHLTSDAPYIPGKKPLDLVEATIDNLEILDEPGGKPKLEDGLKLVLLRGDRRVMLGADRAESPKFYKIRLRGEKPDFITGWVDINKAAPVAQVNSKASKTPADVYAEPDGDPLTDADGKQVTLKDGDRVPKLETQDVDGVVWCKVPARFKQLVWVKKNSGIKEVIEFGAAEVQLYDFRGVPIRDHNKKPVNLKKTRRDYIRDFFIDPPHLSLEPPPPSSPYHLVGPLSFEKPEAAGYMWEFKHERGTACVKAFDLGLQRYWVAVPRQASGTKMYSQPSEEHPLCDPYDKHLDFSNENVHEFYMGEDLRPLDNRVEGGVHWFQFKVEVTVRAWVREDALAGSASEDRPVDEDHGDCGAANHDIGSQTYGVAYGYGCKDTPERFRERLLGIFPAPEGGVKHHRIPVGAKKPGAIMHWDEYSRTQRVGLHEASLFNPENPKDWAGIDCSGFVQTCVTWATFDWPADGLRIVPEAIVKRMIPDKHGAVSGGVECGASSVFGIYARKMPFEGKKGDPAAWLRGGDILANKGHIVLTEGDADSLELIAADPPKTAKNQPAPPPPGPAGETDPLQTPGTMSALKSNRFFVLNAHGVAFERKPPVFTRKTIKMPQRWWGVTLGDSVEAGRIFIWLDQ